MKKLTSIIIGCGNRGKDAYAFYAKNNPDKIKIMAIADLKPERLEIVGNMLDIKNEMRFNNWKDLIKKDKFADTVIISTLDKYHVEPAIEFMKKGYDLLLEKPMDNTIEGTLKISKTAKKLNRKVMVCHVLRYSAFFNSIKKIIDSGEIGEVVNIEHKENISYFHMARSYVRGNWRNSEETAPITLTKCCHDFDILYWLVGSKCVSISSFGSLHEFKKSKKPLNTPERCTDGCPIENECPYSAKKLYLTDIPGYDGWPAITITNDLSFEGRYKAIKEGPYGRCIYSCDNNVMDNQITIMNFENGATVSLMLSAFTAESHRTIRILGTKGEIRGLFEKNELQIKTFGGYDYTLNTISPSIGSHNGADVEMMDVFTKVMQNEPSKKEITSADNSVESHLLAFAAEESRKTNKTINMTEFKKRYDV